MMTWKLFVCGTRSTREKPMWHKGAFVTRRRHRQCHKWRTTDSQCTFHELPGNCWPPILRRRLLKTRGQWSCAFPYQWLHGKWLCMSPLPLQGSTEFLPSLTCDKMWVCLCCFLHIATMPFARHTQLPTTHSYKHNTAIRTRTNTTPPYALVLTQHRHTHSYKHNTAIRTRTQAHTRTHARTHALAPL